MRERERTESAARCCATVSGMSASPLLTAAHRLTSIAFPAISTAIYRFPADRAAQVAVGTVAGEIANAPGAMTRVVFCCFSPDAAECHKTAFAELGLGKRWSLPHQSR